MENFTEYVDVCKKLNSHFLIVDTSTKDGTIQLNLFVGHLAHTSHLMVEFNRISEGMRKTINNFNILHNNTDLTIIETELRKSLELIESTKPFMDIDNWDDAHKKKYSKFCRITNEIYNEINKEILTNPPIKIEPDKRLKKLTWNKSKIDFCELVKALVETKVFGSATQKDILISLNEVFQVELTHEDISSGKKINDIKKRNAGDEIKFLKELEENLKNWVNKKDT